MKYAALVFKNLLRNKRRTILTVLSVGVSLFIFAALINIPTVADQILAGTAGSARIAVINKAGLAYSLPESYKARILAAPHVLAVVPENWFGGIYHDVKDQFFNMAVDPESVDVMWPDWKIAPDALAQFKRVRTACLVGPGTMSRFHLHVGQQIMLRGTIYPFNVTLRIVGLMAGKAPPDFLLFRRDYLEEAAHRPGVAGLYWVRVDDAKNAPQVMAALDESFANSSAETKSESEQAFMGDFLDSFRTFFRIAEFLGLIIVISIGLVAANTAAMSIRERRGEIAVMRSIGFPARTILTLLVAESLLIGLLGGALGCGAAWVALKVFAMRNNAMGPLGLMRMAPVVVAETLVAAALIGILSAIVPAAAAARRNIVDALRAVA